MILWCDGAHGPLENMRRDARLLGRAREGGLRATTLRLFRFAPAGITLGASQRPERELDLGRSRADGIEWAVRPTGGRAIFHDEEWTFSLATRLGPGGWAVTAAAAYARTCRLLAETFRDLGVPVVTAPGSGPGVGPPRVTGGPAPPCFASTARHELTLDGRKFAGIAQRESRGGLLQQGSLLLGASHGRLADYLRLEPEERERVRAALARATAHAGRWLPPATPLERLRDALLARAGDAVPLTGDAGIDLLGPME